MWLAEQPDQQHREQGDEIRREAAPQLVEVSVVRSSPPTSAGISVDLRSGHRLDVRAGFDDHELRRLIVVLESC